jgi:hypothetical protein
MATVEKFQPTRSDRPRRYIQPHVVDDVFDPGRFLRGATLEQERGDTAIARRAARSESCRRL